LQSRRVVDVRDRGDLGTYDLQLANPARVSVRFSQWLPLVVRYRSHQQHVGALDASIDREVPVCLLGQHGMSEGAKPFTKLHLEVHHGLGVRIARIAEDAAVAE